MSDVKKDLAFYRNRCRELESRVNRFQDERILMQRNIEKSRIPSGVSRELFEMEETGASPDEISERFLQVTLEALCVSCAALLTYEPEKGSYAARYVRGFPAGRDLNVSPPDPLEEFCCVNPSGAGTPMGKILCNVAGVPYLTWISHSGTGTALLVGNESGKTGPRILFEPTDREILEDILKVYVYIAEKKKTEQALRESEKHYRLFAETVSDIIWTMDRNLKINYISPSTVHFTGHTPEEILSMSLGDYLTPSSLEKAANSFLNERNREEAEPSDPFFSHTLELEHLRKDGSTVWAEVNYTFLKDPDGKINGLLGVTRDITERKQTEQALLESEKRYRLLAENVRDVIWTTDMNLHNTFSSPSVTALRGYSVEEVGRTSLEEDLTPESFRVAMDAFSEELEAEKKGERNPLRSRTLELEFRCKDGSTVWTEVRASFLRGENGDPVGILGVSRDISDRKKAEEALHKSEEQLLQSQKLEAVGRLAGGIAHDFNNLMTVINGYCDLLLMRIGKQSPIRNEIEEIKNAGARAAALTCQLVAFSRRQKLQQRLMDLNNLVVDMSRILQHLISEDTELVILLEQKLDRIKADSGQIHQVILNLTLNAIDAMPEGGKLTLRTKNFLLDKRSSKGIPESSPGRFVCLSVSDTGLGMEKVVKDQIFEPFFSTKKVGEGSGLGLATVYGIVKQHEGWINVSSDPGRGTTFEINLPAFSETLEEEDEEKIPLEGLQGRGERILLVEDEEGVCDFATKVLAENGYEVLGASNSEHALELFGREDGRFHLIFSDVVLPGKNGIQLVEQLLSRNSGTKVLFCSGHKDEKSQRMAIRERGFRFLRKPYNMSELLLAVQDAIRNG